MFHHQNEKNPPMSPIISQQIKPRTIYLTSMTKELFLSSGFTTQICMYFSTLPRMLHGQFVSSSQTKESLQKQFQWKIIHKKDKFKTTAISVHSVLDTKTKYNM
jgi:hypothetical protein